MEDGYNLETQRRGWKGILGRGVVSVKAREVEKYELGV